MLVNSNPATIMTDPGLADRTYVEPLDVEAVEQVIAREHPDALLPTLGGQTALNLAMDLHQAGVLERHGVELIGADADAIHRAEDRDAFKDCMRAAGLDVLESRIVTDVAGARAAAAELGYPVILRPAFTLGGGGRRVGRRPRGSWLRLRERQRRDSGFWRRPNSRRLAGRRGHDRGRLLFFEHFRHEDDGQRRDDGGADQALG